MSVEYILNELSIQEPLVDIDRAKAVMDIFVDVLKAARDFGIRPSIRSHIAVDQIELCAGYYISNWCVDQGISKEKRIYIAKLLTNSPLLVGLAPEISEDIREVGVKFEGKLGNGLTLAFLTENPVLSFNSDTRWDPATLEVLIERLKINPETGETELVEERSSITNFSTIESLKENREKVRLLLERRFTSIDNFWEKRGQIFDRLELSPGVRDSLNELNVGAPLFQQIVRRLSEINRYCEQWTDGPCLIASQLPNVSGESTTTMQEFGEDRKFRNSSGEYFSCALHARITPGPHRIHFFPLAPEKKIFIGYIGRKLRTSTTAT